jgi:hypothetical protein
VRRDDKGGLRVDQSFKITKGEGADCSGHSGPAFMVVT